MNELGGQVLGRVQVQDLGKVPQNLAHLTELQLLPQRFPSELKGQ